MLRFVSPIGLHHCHQELLHLHMFPSSLPNFVVGHPLTFREVLGHVLLWRLWPCWRKPLSTSRPARPRPEWMQHPLTWICCGLPLCDFQWFPRFAMYKDTGYTCWESFWARFATTHNAWGERLESKNCRRWKLMQTWPTPQKSPRPANQIMLGSTCSNKIW